ncbi:MAG TPA: carboxymuconolactone decarboxylase [Flavobacteriaceae bacterium]|nr:carboxymuconolactone decarboxylase [Flavobacteriaceae bacterium]
MKFLSKTKLFLLFLFIFNYHSMNVYAQNSLSAKQKSIVSIAATTTVGDLNQLKTQLNIGFENKLTLNETEEILVQSYAYCGFPRSLNAVSTLMALVKEREEKGLKTNVGKEASSINKGIETYERGRKTLETLTKTPQSRPAPGFGEFAPRADQFLKEHLFADIFDNDVLTYQERELATIAMLASLAGVQPQLKAHIDMGKNTGITQEQLVEATQIIENLVSRTQANSFRKLIQVEEFSNCKYIFS